jgi:RecG-like helicase
MDRLICGDVGFGKTKVAICSCKHTEQDKLYGKGNRLMNKTIKGKWRCTVCGTVKD